MPVRKDYPVVTTKHGADLIYDPKDVCIGPYIAQTGLWEKEETQLCLDTITPQYCCIDIGANIGYYTTLFAGVPARVVAFEPDPHTFEILQHNIIYNRCSRPSTTLVRSAITDKVGTTELYRCPYDNKGDHRLFLEDDRDQASGVVITTFTLDSLMKKKQPLCDIYDYRRCFIKSDAQGSEGLILRGAKKFLSRPFDDLQIVMELWPKGLNACGTPPEEVLDMLYMLDFTISIVNADGVVPTTRDKLSQVGKCGPPEVTLLCRKGSAT